MHEQGREVGPHKRQTDDVRQWVLACPRLILHELCELWLDIMRLVMVRVGMIEPQNVKLLKHQKCHNCAFKVA